MQCSLLRNTILRFCYSKGVDVYSWHLQPIRTLGLWKLGQKIQVHVKSKQTIRNWIKHVFKLCTPTRISNSLVQKSFGLDQQSHIFLWYWECCVAFLKRLKCVYRKVINASLRRLSGMCLQVRTRLFMCFRVEL